MKQIIHAFICLGFLTSCGHIAELRPTQEPVIRYATSIHEIGTSSMQSQVFAKLDEFNASDKPVGKLLITGHSLATRLSIINW